MVLGALPGIRLQVDPCWGANRPGEREASLPALSHMTRSQGPTRLAAFLTQLDMRHGPSKQQRTHCSGFPAQKGTVPAKYRSTTQILDAERGSPALPPRHTTTLITWPVAHLAPSSCSAGREGPVGEVRQVGGT